MLELLNVNPSSGEPIYKQLHEQVVRLIVGGQLQVEDVLPSVRQIAEHLAVNPMTVSRAIQQLVDQGWLERRRGQATRVAPRTEAMTSGGRGKEGISGSSGMSSTTGFLAEGRQAASPLTGWATR